jgi:hypothetical protein
MSTQGDRQALVRAATGTALNYEGDWHTLFDQRAIAPGNFNGRFITWVNNSLSTSYTNINDAMAAYAANEGTFNWTSLSTLSQGSNPNLLAPFSWTAGAATSLSIVGSYARNISTDGATPPRITKGPFAVTNGKSYTFSGTVYNRSATNNSFFRVATTAAMPAGDVYNFTQSPGEVDNLTAQFGFTATYTGNAYVGIVAIVSTIGDYQDIDNNFSIVQV